jgi:Fe2+ transport system protein FeoA
MLTQVTLWEENSLATKSQLTYLAPDMNSRTSVPQGSRASICPNPALCPLNRVRAGSAVRVRQLAAAPQVNDRLRELGFCEDQQVRLLSQEDNIICQVCNVRLGISARLAEAILVEPVTSAPVS